MTNEEKLAELRSLRHVEHFECGCCEQVLWLLELVDKFMVKFPVSGYAIQQLLEMEKQDQGQDPSCDCEYKSSYHETTCSLGYR